MDNESEKMQSFETSPYDMTNKEIIARALSAFMDHRLEEIESDFIATESRQALDKKPFLRISFHRHHDQKELK